MFLYSSYPYQRDLHLPSCIQLLPQVSVDGVGFVLQGLELHPRGGQCLRDEQTDIYIFIYILIYI